MSEGVNSDFYRVAREHVRQDKARHGRDTTSQWDRPKGTVDPRQADLLAPESGTFRDFVWEAQTRAEGSDRYLRQIAEGSSWKVRFKRVDGEIRATVDVDGFRYEATGMDARAAIEGLDRAVARGVDASAGAAPVGDNEAVRIPGSDDPKRRALRHFRSRTRALNTYEREGMKVLPPSLRMITAADRRAAEALGIEVPEDGRLRTLLGRAVPLNSYDHDDRWRELEKGGDLAEERERTMGKVGQAEMFRTDRYKGPTP